MFFSSLPQAHLGRLLCLAPICLQYFTTQDPDPIYMSPYRYGKKNKKERELRI